MDNIQNPMRGRAAALIIKEGGLLLVYRKNKGDEYYVLPGGGVKPGETPAQAVVREMKEEAGVDIQVGKLLWERLDEKMGQHQYYFRVEIVGEEQPTWREEYKQKTDNEYRFEWVFLGELSKITLHPQEVKPLLMTLNEIDAN